MTGDTAHVSMMYHPSHHVLDLAEAGRWFERVFALPSTNIAAVLDQGHPTPGRSTNYAIFTLIRDVLFDTIDPERYVLDHVQQYPSITSPHLKGLGWYVEDAAALYRKLRAAGFRIVDQLGRPAEGTEPPMAGPMPLFFTTADDAGLRYEFLPRFPFPLDPRPEPGFVLSPPSSTDPLGILHCSHHTILTTRPERQLHLLVDVLGGTVIHDGRDDVIGALSTYVHLADAVYEIAEPDQGTPARADWADRSPADTYHSLTFLVADLERVERHLDATGVVVRTRTPEAIVVDPATALGIPWGFTTAGVPGDPRTPTTHP
jgi:hypothetical protein